MTHLIATFFYAGHMRPAPGTWGSLAALPAAWAIYMLTGPWGLVIGVLTSFALGLWATAEETRGQDDHDPSEIVIDEVAGQWIALLPIAFGAARNDVAITDLWPGWIAAFVLFRLFDISKPGPVGWADRMHGPMGVMLDDVIAGIFAAIGVVGLAALFHLVLM
ncbi:phosphatidylglycerophosphatase A family protein [Yoonia sediminilitoris]|uniref:Phosphatidylglycerophosphatase A n=1 Tax=Yoonia sediminilitoris TaxID=1286148 RepID=A0A2T6KS88_9RHOB|nr:phosphatidylglycerophosphatase A [Yoonia sediminilitoris]PUB19385.1 phosphatidylglycerophosphatase A [Yoonia sediminilitoris]RCW99553.1 phosphatidylglycerophosphatase A [Yoonia sediminilitoris]